MSNTKFRFIKIQMWNDSWRTYKYQNNFYRKINFIKKKIQGEEYLLYSPAKNVYHSLNQFLSFKEHNSTYKFQNRIMKKYGLIDIDSQNFKSKEEAVDCFNRIILFLQKKKIRMSEINLTNINGGFQIIIHHSSYKRFYYILTASLLREEELFNKIDWKVMNDDKRVKRYVPSWNSNKNSWAIPLLKNEEISMPFGLKTTISKKMVNPNVFETKGLDRGSISPYLMIKICLQSQDLNSFVSNKELVIDFLENSKKLSPLFPLWD